MPIVPLFGISQQGKSATVTAQRHLNLYAQIDQIVDKSSIQYYGTPGLILFTGFGDTPIRGMYSVGDFIYLVHRGTFWKVDNSGLKTNLGSLSTTTGRVDISYNGLQIGIVDGLAMYMYTISTAAFVVVTSGLMSNPISITYQDSYFIACFANSGRFQISSSYDGTTWNALDFASAESNPDNLVRVIADHGELVLCGQVTFEFWGNSGNQSFPYTTIRGATSEYGLAAPFSLVKFNDALAGVMKNRNGQVQVMVSTQHTMVKISSPEVDYLMNAYPAVSDATAFAYLLGGHPMLEINFPSAGKSWLYDAISQLWSPLESGLTGGRHLAEIQVDYLNNPRVSDYANGNIYTLSTNSYTDNGAPIARELIGAHFFKDYQRVSISKVQIDFETGVGLSTGQGMIPQCMLQISKDNGHTWGNENWTTIGAIGTYLTRAIWRRLGIARDWVFKIRITDPVKVVITGASVDAEGI